MVRKLGAGIRKPNLKNNLLEKMNEQDRTIKNDQKSETHLYPWQRRWLDFEQMTMGGLMVGAPGSGKTVSMKMLMKPVLKRIKDGHQTRAVVYDSKTDMMPFFAAILGEEQFDEKTIILNPLDSRASAWDMANDIEDRFQIETFASNLIPAPQSLESNRYFNQTAQMILAQVMIALDQIASFQTSDGKKRGNWRLKDLVMICRSETLMRTLLEMVPATRPTVAEHFHKDNPAFQSVKSTLAVHMAELESIALAWDHFQDEGQTFTTKEWIDNPRLIVLGNNHRAREATRRINTLMLSQLQMHVLDLDFETEDSPDKDKESWFILDEFRELGKIENFNDFLVTCRAKRAPVVVGFQDISGLYALYKKEPAQEILACFNSLSMFHINNSNPPTQKWASDTIGQEWDEAVTANTSSGESAGGYQSSRGTSKKYELQTVMQPPEFSKKLPLIKTSGELHSASIVSGEFAKMYIPAEELFQNPESMYFMNDEGLTKTGVPCLERFDLSTLDTVSVWTDKDAKRLHQGLEGYQSELVDNLMSSYRRLLEEGENNVGSSSGGDDYKQTVEDPTQDGWKGDVHTQD